MLAAVLHGARDIRVEETPIPVPGDGEVVIKVEVCSVCGSDLHAYNGMHPKVTYPRILGHEYSGVVNEVGKGVNEVKPGDRVGTDTNLTCGACVYCRNGRVNLCPSSKTLGFNMDGAYAQYIKIPAGINIYHLPDNVTFEEAALAQPLGVGFNAVKRRAEVTVGDVVAIMGAGPIGLSCLLLAKASGAFVVISDTLDHRLETARKLGADVTINISQEDLMERIRELTGGEGVDKVIEAVGGRQDMTLMQSTQIVRRGGLIVVVGTFSDNKASLRITEFKDREMELKGARGQHNTFKPCMRLLSTGRVNVKPMISHVLSLQEIESGLQMMTDPAEKVSKIIIKF